jgi:cyanate permease
VLAGILIVAGILPFLFWPDQMAWACALGASIGTTIAFAAAIAAPAEFAPPDRIGSTAGFMLALGYVQAMLGPFLLGLLRDLLGSYQVGWWLLLGMGVLLLVTSMGVPGRAEHRALAVV